MSIALPLLRLAQKDVRTGGAVGKVAAAAYPQRLINGLLEAMSVSRTTPVGWPYAGGGLRAAG